MLQNKNCRLSRNWAGEEDLSGRFWVGFTATDLLVAGEVRDDDLRLNPLDWWTGDEVEVSFNSFLILYPKLFRRSVFSLYLGELNSISLFISFSFM